MVASQYTLHDLPATSQVLIEVLELCQRTDSTHLQLAEVIVLDPVLLATLLSMTADQIDLQDSQLTVADQIVARLGRAAIQSVALDIARRLCQQGYSVEQQACIARLWRRMVLAAKLSSAFALLTHYNNPGEAYIAGLLQGMGRLRVVVAAFKDPLLITTDADGQAWDTGDSLFEQDHAQWVYQLVSSWGMPGFLADALRYQNFGLEQVADAHPLVKLSSLSAQLANARYDVVDRGLHMARQLYGIAQPLSEEILSQARTETQRAGAGLAIQEQSEFSPQPIFALARLVDDLLQVQTLISSINADRSAGLKSQSIVARVLSQALGSKHFRVLSYDAAGSQLVGFSDGRAALPGVDGGADWQISLEPARSAMALAYTRGLPAYMDMGEEGSTVADRQLLGLLQQPAALCLPVVAGTDQGSLVVAGGSEDSIRALLDRSRYLDLVCGILGGLQDDIRSEKPVPAESGVVEAEELLLREMVHEVSNPLSIASNYLGILSHKLERQGETYSELDIIREELERATRLMHNWGRTGSAQVDTGKVEANRLIERLLQSYRANLLEPKSIELVLKLDANESVVSADEGSLQQILRNLLGNAIDAVQVGGRIELSSISEVYMDSGAYVALLVADNGPGIPERVRENIFSPVESTKGEGHSGIGLSIVKSLVDKLQGKIAFRTGPEGTEFQIYLPK